MKKISRFVSMLMVLALTFSVFSMPSYAANKINNIKSGKSFAIEVNTSEQMVLYKVKLKKESVIYLTCGTTDDYHRVDIYKGNINTHLTGSYSNKEGMSYGFKKGTYYFSFTDAASAGVTAKFTIIDPSKVNKKNYNRANAVNVKANNWTYIARTPSNSYARWYKVNLKGNKKVKITTKYTTYYTAIELMDANYNEVKLNCVNETTFVTKKKPAKGIYYLRIDSGTQADSVKTWMTETYNAFKWTYK